MLQLLAQIVPLAIAGAISPVVLMGALAILDGPRAIRQSAAFSAGVIGTTIVLFVAGFLVAVLRRDGDTPAWFSGDRAHVVVGVMLIVAPTERKVRIEVGYGLEPMLTDALSSVIIQKSILPRFRKSDFNGGVTQGVDALVQQLSLDPTAAEKKVAAAEAQAQAAGEDDGGWWPFLIFLGLAGFYLFVLRRIWPFTLLASGGWSSGGFGGSSFGGGGGGVFSGGGGSFGGGGASGSW